MKINFVKVIILYLSLIVSNSAGTTFNKKVLLLSATNDPQFEAGINLAKNTLEQRGIPYIHFAMEEISSDDLEKIAFKGNEYLGIIWTSNQLTDKYGQSSISEFEIDLLSYMAKENHLRSVYLYSYPNKKLQKNGISIQSNHGKLPQDSNIFWNKMSFPWTDVYQDQGIINTASEDIWAYPVRLNNLSCNKCIVPFMWLESNNRSNPYENIMAFRSNVDKKEDMHFLFSQATWSKTSNILKSAWLSWLLKGKLQYTDKAYLSLQIDDIFLASDIKNEEITIYRTTADDLNWHANWQKTMAKYFESNIFKLEFAFNGVEEKNNDDLIIFSTEKGESFNWINHTFNHQNLDEAKNLSLISNEIETNRIFFSELSMKNTKSIYSPAMLVTPEISGITDVKIMNHLKQLNIDAIVGDNSRKELIPSNYYLGEYRSNIFILPRHATEIYYFNTNTSGLIKSYRQIKKQFATTTSVIQNEKDRALFNLTNNDPAPYMFHQANLKVHKCEPLRCTNDSLISLWTQEVIKEYQLYFKRPLTNHRMLNLVNIYKNRQAANKEPKK